MDMSENGLKFLADVQEGDILHMYHDSAGYPTLGVGHLLLNEEKVSGYVNINGSMVDWTQGITEEQSLALLTHDLKRFVAAVNGGVTVTLNQNQFDALVAFAFNIGDAGFLSSTVLKRVNAQEFDQVPAAMLMWDEAGGKVSQDMVACRNKEIKLWNGEETL